MGRKHTYDSLTGLKGLFSLIIVFFHTLPETPLIEQIPLTSLIKNYGGELGNYFFFIASGFLLSIGYRDKIGNKEVLFKEFLLKRLRKLYPLYIITNLAALLINVIQFGPSAVNLKTIVFTALLQCGGGLDVADPYNGPSWFISALFVCYMAFFFIAYHAKNRTHYCCMIGFGIVWGYSILSGRWEVPLSFAHHGDSFFGFFIGCVLAEVYPMIGPKMHKWLQPSSFFVLVCSGYLFLRYGVEVIAGDVRVAFACLLCPLMIYLALWNKPLSLILQSRPIRYLGKISFSIYLWHFVVYDFFRYAYSGLSNGKRIEEPQYLLYLACVTLVGAISYRFIENGTHRNASVCV